MYIKSKEAIKLVENSDYISEYSDAVGNSTSMAAEYIVSKLELCTNLCKLAFDGNFAAADVYLMMQLLEREENIAMAKIAKKKAAATLSKKLINKI